MILYNTTFHIDSAIEDVFIAWLKSRYIGQASTHGFRQPLLTRLINQLEPGCTSYALHLRTELPSLVKQWEDGEKISLTQEMFCLWGERALSFSTTMEIIEI